MGRMVATEYVSLDGLVQAQAGSRTSSTQAGSSSSTADRRAKSTSSTRP